MDDSEATSLEQVRAYLAGSGEVRFVGPIQINDRVGTDEAFYFAGDAVETILELGALEAQQARLPIAQDRIQAHLDLRHFAIDAPG